MPYTPPGVYARFLEKGYIAVLPGMVRIPAFIGEGQHTKQIHAEAVVRTGATTDTLSHSDIVSIDRVGDTPLSTNYEEGVDWDLVEDANQIQWLNYPTFGIGEAPDIGATYYVTYTYTKSESDYKAKLFFSLEDVEAEYGAVIEEGEVANTLTLAAQIAFENGATAIMCVQKAEDEGWTEPLARLENQDCDIIVPIYTSELSDLANVKAHVVDQSLELNKHERIAFVGAPVDSEISYFFSTGSERGGLVQQMSHKRVVVFAPDGAVKTLRDADGNVITPALDGSYLAAAAAGKLCSPSYPWSEPLTRKSISGFDSLNTAYNESEKNALGARGCCVIHAVGGDVRIRDGITSDVTSVNSQEISVVSLIDYCMEAMRSGLDNHIGTVITGAKPAEVEATAKSILAKLIDNRIINAYNELSAKVDGTDPRRINVIFNIYPVYPLKWIRVSFSWYSV